MGPASDLAPASDQGGYNWSLSCGTILAGMVTLSPWRACPLCLDEIRMGHPIVSCFRNVRSESKELRGPAVSGSVVAERSGLVWKGVVCYRSWPFKGSGLSELPCFGRDLRQNGCQWPFPSSILWWVLRPKKHSQNTSQASRVTEDVGQASRNSLTRFNLLTGYHDIIR